MGRRICDTDATTAVEPARKRTRTMSESCELNSSVIIDRPLPPGEILTDVTQKQWRIGKPIGCGSFGEIYLASDDITKEANAQNSRYVIKIEPHSNGPLFVEIHCLIRTARHSKIKKWQNEKKLKLLGMPHYIANGSHLLDDTRYRFLVLPRYERDVEKVLRLSSTHTMQLRNVLVLGAQIIDILEYLHCQGYAHSDIKSSNLMVGFNGSNFTSQNCSQVNETNAVTRKSDIKTKPKVKYASYYYDEDFVLHNYLSSNSNTDYETDDDSSDVEKSRTSKFISLSKNSKITQPPGNCKNMRMKGLFNLRKLKSDVNYEDLNSSICSYDSYQDLLENNNAKNKIHFTQPYNQLHENKCSDNGDDNEINHFEEAVCSQSPGQVYLLDFGLASKFIDSDGTHKEFMMDQRKAHDGTLEYSSRDSHIGAHSRRSDLENLGYNILDWLTGSLPWKKPEMLQDPTLVHALKKSYMEDVKRLMEVCFKSQTYPKFIEKYFNYITKLEFHENPDYRYCKNIFINEFRDNGFGTAEDMILNFNSNFTPRKRINYSKKINKNPSKNTPPDFLKRNAIVKVFGRENLHGNSWENDLKMNIIRESLSNDGIRKPCISRNFFVSDADLIAKLRQTLLLAHDTPSKKFSPKNLRSTKHIIKVKKGGRNNKNNIGKFGNFLGSDKQYTWAEILAGNPESIARKIEKGKNGQCTIEKNHSKNPRSRKVSNASDVSVNTVELNASPILLQKDYLSNLNPTYAMKEVVENYRRKTLGKTLAKNDESENVSNEQCFTPAMIKVMKIIEKRQNENVIAEKESKKTKTNIEKKPTPKKRTSIKNSKSKNISTTPLPSSSNDKQAPRKVQYKKVLKSKTTNKATASNENTTEEESNVSVRKLRCRSITSVAGNSPSKKTKTPKRKVEIVIDAKPTPVDFAPAKGNATKLRKVQEPQKRAPVKRIIATRSRGPVK
ncbi:back seat driver [Arctopsyche grandis]|uniref:back seat driver n=1 Tax=Arctopsyche grandis TaxID=121162 RepID=UPI00406D6768